MKLNVAATKTNLIKTKQALTLTQEGHSLLDEKRRILTAELTVVIHALEHLQKEVDDIFVQAYAALDKAIVGMGRLSLESLAAAVKLDHDLIISSRRVMGVNLPIIKIKLKDNPPYFSLSGVSLSVDEAIAKFKQVLEVLVNLAEKRITLLRLGKEAQRTIRKVNALEKVYLPLYQGTIKSISDRLEEESREAFSILKLIKQRLAKN